MTDHENRSGAGQRTIVLRGVDETEVTWWADARKIDARAFDRVEFLDVVRHRSGRCDVTLAIPETVVEGLADGIESTRGIEAGLRSALYDLATEVIENEHLRSEAESIPECSANSEFGPLTVVAEWTMLQALEIQHWIRESIGDVARIELARLGSVSEDAVTVAVSLPVLIFDAATTAYRSGRGEQSLSDCVHNAIEAAGMAESKLAAESSDDHIPF